MRHLLLAATALIVSVPALAQTATPGTPQSPSSLRSVGSSCIQEMRMLETISSGTPQTPFLQFGDVVHIDVFDSAGHYFGAIEQRVVKYHGRSGRWHRPSSGPDSPRQQ